MPKRPQRKRPRRAKKKATRRSVSGAAAGRRTPGWVPALAIGLVVFALGWILGRGGRAPEQRDEAPTTIEENHDRAQGAAQEAVEGGGPSSSGVEPTPRGMPLVERSRVAPTADQRPRAADVGEPLVALVIDDLGRSLTEVRELEALNVPISYSVLPFERRTAEVRRHLSDNDREILLHLPMEATGPANPGPGALFSSMSREELRAATERALQAVPEAVGVNNHMGSRLSTDRDAMTAVLGAIGAQGVFFLDSRTSSDSLAFEMARQFGIAAAERHVFLDPEASRQVTELQFERALERARTTGSAIAIGHPYPTTVEVLRERLPAAKAGGIRFVPVSFLLESDGLESSGG